MSVPDYHCKPKVRLQKPISLLKPDNHPPSPLRNYEFREVQSRELRQQFDLVYDPITPVQTNGPIFSGDFECGNLGQVYQIGPMDYEIHLIPDPNETPTTQWFFFKVENLRPGTYFFCIVGFYRACNLHWKGSKACVYSERNAEKGIGWQRIGDNLNYFKWKSAPSPEWAFSFNFTVTEPDTMYFAHAYPYTYTDLLNYINNLPPQFKFSTLSQSVGDVSVPALLWDADIQEAVDIPSLLENAGKVNHSAPEIRVEDPSEFSESLLDILRNWREDQSIPHGKKYDTKPLCIIVARTHPGESNSSFAMEGFMNVLFGDNPVGKVLLQNYSWLLIPMINPEGVICGFYRPSLSGNDMNRVWKDPDPILEPIANNTLILIEHIQKTKPIHFFLDFHGHTAAFNSFVYGFSNENNCTLYSTERVFPLLMTKYTDKFSNEMCSYLKQKCYEGTMRVVLRRRFLILFAYTLEMSYGGCNFGPYRNSQFTIHDYREIGDSVARAIHDLFEIPQSLASREAMLLLPPPDKEEELQFEKVESTIYIDGISSKKNPTFFSCTADDIKFTTTSKCIKLALKSYNSEGIVV